MKNNLIERITNLGYGLDGFGTFNLHHPNGKTNIMAAISEKQLLLKYEHYEHSEGKTLFVIYKAENGNYNKATFNTLKNGTSDDKYEDLNKDNFYEEINKIISLIELDPDELDYLPTPKLYEKYKSFRNTFDNSNDKTINWENEDLLYFFNQELWENREEEDDPIDVKLITFIQLNDIYNKEEKSDHKKPILQIVTSK